MCQRADSNALPLGSLGLRQVDGFFRNSRQTQSGYGKPAARSLRSEPEVLFCALLN